MRVALPEEYHNMIKTLIIAEAGVNHNGSLDNARRLVDCAAEAGADFVKFQTFKADKIISKNAAKADYQVRTTGGAESQLEMVKRLELSESDHYALLDHCKKRGIEFLSTAFDSESIDLLVSMGIKLGKIPSGELTNLPYLRKMAVSFPQLILSTGMATSAEIKDTLDALLQAGADKKQLSILHCNTEYPTPVQDVNLRAMLSIKELFGTQVGYSDHTRGIEIPLAAVAMGATIIEKHFTLDRAMEGPDHAASLEPPELKAMVQGIRNIEQALQGSGYKEPSASEIKNITIARKSIVAARDIRQGEAFTQENITVKRPGTGISPMKWDEVIGTLAPCDFKADELIRI